MTGSPRLVAGQVAIRAKLSPHTASRQKPLSWRDKPARNAASNSVRTTWDFPNDLLKGLRAVLAALSREHAKPTQRRSKRLCDAWVDSPCEGGV
jgi:hypothetical protein